MPKDTTKTFLPDNFEMTCIRCDKALEEGIQHEGERQFFQPWPGLVLYASGNYGSTCFDMEQGELVLWLCDECAKKNASRILHMVTEKVTHQYFKVWNNEFEAWEWDMEKREYEPRPPEKETTE